MENKTRKNWNYYRLNFNVYKVEVGVLLDKDNEEYEFYLYYDKKQHTIFFTITMFLIII